jgi:hypothetical protein
MSQVRPFVRTDLPQVARLHRMVFEPGERSDADTLESHCAHLSRVFIDHPSGDADLPCFVYEEDDGRIVGFLGVAPRRMSFDGRRLQAAISSQTLADPASRTVLVSVELAKAFLDGPQDLSISDQATEGAREIWEGLGGTTALLHSIYWTRPLRPAQLALSFLRNRISLAPLAAMADPLARIVDAIATRLRHSHLYQAMPPVSVDDRLEETFLTWQPEFAGAGSLRVEYDDVTFKWVLERCAQRRAATLHKAVIRNDGQVMGWYLYDLNRTGIADVLQIAAKPDSVHDVLDNLFYSAWQQGAMAVTGRLEPRFMQAFSDKYCLFHRRGPWTLVSARKPEFLRAFLSEGVFFSRFDGEWCLGY